VATSITNYLILKNTTSPTVEVGLAEELALASVDVAIVERLDSNDLVGSRSGGLHSRTIESFDQRGIADRFLAEGQKAQVARIRRISRIPAGIE
jgi:2-polyprenyl-6-methoxyphenol hydroxylase-like FAD-dependent oxidoreductase